jgi:predicted nucleic acid-binding protein
MTAAAAGRVTVLDASIVVEWFSPSAPALRATVLQVLSDVQAAPRSFVVPTLLFQEVHAVLCRRIASDADVDSALEDIYALGLQVAPFDRSTAREATRIAHRYGLTGYDATYAATAKLLGGIWATLDRKAHARVANLGLSRVL